MNRRAGAASSAMRNHVVAGSSVATVGWSPPAAARERGDALVARRVEVVGGQRAELRRQLRAAGRGELVGVQAERHPVAGRRLEDPAALVGREHALLAEHVA